MNYNQLLPNLKKLNNDLISLLNLLNNNKVPSTVQLQFNEYQTHYDEYQKQYQAYQAYQIELSWFKKSWNQPW